MSTYDFYIAGKAVLEKLVKEHPEAVKLLMTALALTEASKRRHEAEQLAYHDDSIEIKPMDVEALARAFDLSCDKAVMDDSVTYQEHNAYRTLYSLLESMSQLGYGQLGPQFSTDEELKSFAETLIGPSDETDSQSPR